MTAVLKSEPVEMHYGGTVVKIDPDHLKLLDEETRLGALTDVARYMVNGALGEPSSPDEAARILDAAYRTDEAFTTLHAQPEYKPGELTDQ